MSQTCEMKSIRTFRFEGRLDSAKCGQLDDDLQKSLAQSTSHIVFDLSEVDMVSSAFLRLCMFFRDKAGANGFQIVNVDPVVRTVFQAAGLDDMIKG